MAQNDGMTDPTTLPSRDLAMLAYQRMVMNVQRTGHPFHHATATGVIVDSDPTLEEWRALVKPRDMPATPAYDVAKVKPSVPVDRHWYEDPINLARVGIGAPRSHQN